jgi:hypothetical protein
MRYMSLFARNRKLASFLLFILGTQAAIAQTPPPAAPASDEPELVEFDTSKTRSIAVPALVAPAPADTAAGNSVALGRQIADKSSNSTAKRKKSPQEIFMEAILDEEKEVEAPPKEETEEPPSIPDDPEELDRDNLGGDDEL